MDMEKPTQPEPAPERLPEPTRPRPEPGNAPEGEPGNRWATPEAERPPKRREGMMSDPDF